MKIEAEAILFDNDGVLVDSHREVVQAWRQVASEFELDADRLLVELIGVRAVDTLGRHLDGDRLEAAVQRLEELEVDLAPQTRPLSGAHELIDQLAGLSWTIVTSAARRLAEARWSGAGIAFPLQTVTAEDVTHGKPHPEPFLAGARLLGIDAARCVVFEDSPSGGAGALAAGATVIAVGTLPWKHEPVARVPDLTVVSVLPGPGHGFSMTLGETLDLMVESAEPNSANRGRRP